MTKEKQLFENDLYGKLQHATAYQPQNQLEKALREINADKHLQRAMGSYAVQNKVSGSRGDFRTTRSKIDPVGNNVATPLDCRIVLLEKDKSRLYIGPDPNRKIMPIFLEKWFIRKAYWGNHSRSPDGFEDQEDNQQFLVEEKTDGFYLTENPELKKFRYAPRGYMYDPEKDPMYYHCNFAQRFDGKRVGSLTEFASVTKKEVIDNLRKSLQKVIAGEASVTRDFLRKAFKK